MRFYFLFVLLAGASYALASTAGALAVTAVWRAGARRLERTSSDARARCLAAYRLAPVLGGLASVAVVGGVYWRLEPRDTSETAGPLLLLLAAASAVMPLAGCARLAEAVRRTRACVRLARACGQRPPAGSGFAGWILDTPAPVAALVGILSPRILLSRRIVDTCSTAEVDLIVRHEKAHLRRRDNLVRALLESLPDPLTFTSEGRRLVDAWAAATEQAADDEAAGADMAARADLAAALVRVAGLADDRPSFAISGPAFYEGEHLERRVHRLLQPPIADRRRGSGVILLALAGCGIAAVVFTDAAATSIHDVMESVVARLA